MDKMNERECANKRFEALKAEASTWLATWKDIQTFVAPTRGNFDMESPNQGTSLDHKSLLDSTQVMDNITLASGLMSGLTSPSRPWFKLGVNDPQLMEEKTVMEWLHTVEQRMSFVFQESNVYSTLYNIYEELGSFGTASMSVLEDPETVIHTENFTCGEFYLSHNRRGFVNGFGREFWLTAEQIVEKFGYDNCSSNVKRLLKEKMGNSWVQVRHLIQENSKYVEGKAVNDNKPFSSKYWEVNNDKDMFLSKSGFFDFPIMAPRWSVPTNMNTYSKGSPAWQALGDIKMLQKMQKDKLLGLDKTVNPPVQVDSSVTGEVNLLPNGITRSSAQTPNAGIRSAYTVQLNLNELDQSIAKVREDIGRHFYRQLFLAITYADNKGMTAREVSERHAEKLLVIGPVLLKLQKELLNPLIDRTFNIMVRNGLVPEPPIEIQGMDISIEYISTLAQAQRSVGTQEIEQSIGFMSSVASIDPTALDVINVKQAVQEYARMKGVSPSLIRSDEELTKMAIDRAREKQRQEQMQNAGVMLDAAKQLSDTNLESRNALTDMVGITGADNE